MSDFTASVFGATGLVGSCVVSELEKSNQYSKIIKVSRNRAQPVVASKNLVTEIVDFESLENFPQVFEVDHVFCCLGTTIKTAGSRKKFVEVDLEYPRKIARLAQMKGVKHFSFVSSMGADINSLFFYLRTKGLAEAAVMQIPFQSVRIYRPSILIGNRSHLGQPSRPFESAMQVMLQKISALMLGPLKRLQPVCAKKLAEYMRSEAVQAEGATKIIESEGINAFSQTRS